MTHHDKLKLTFGINHHKNLEAISQQNIFFCFNFLKGTYFLFFVGRIGDGTPEGAFYPQPNLTDNPLFKNFFHIDMRKFIHSVISYNF